MFSRVHGIFPGHDYWSGLPFPPTGDLSDSRLKPTSSALAGGSFTHRAFGEALLMTIYYCKDSVFIQGLFSHVNKIIPLLICGLHTQKGLPLDPLSPPSHPRPPPPCSVVTGPPLCPIFFHFTLKSLFSSESTKVPSFYLPHHFLGSAFLSEPSGCFSPTLD